METLQQAPTDPNIQIAVRNLEMAFGSYVIQQHLSFDIRYGEIFIIMGSSGCG